MALQTALGALDALTVSSSTNDVVPWDKKKTPGAGGHRSSGSTSISAIVATFIPTFLTAVLFMAVFVAIRQSYRKIYLPRTYIGVVPEKDRTPSPDRGRLGWVKDLLVLDDKFVLRHQSLDAYLYLRFLKTIIAVCFVGCCITWPILFPVNATGGGDATQLDRISFSNISGTARLYAHTIIAWLFLGFVMFYVARERVFLIGLRQAYLLSKANSTRLSSRTVLFLAAPDEALKEQNVQRIFGKEARKTWKVTRLDELESLVDDRNNKAMMLEGAEVALSRKLNEKRIKDHHQNGHSNGFDVDSEHHDNSTEKECRPTHRLVPLVGKKVDTIEWSRTATSEAASKVQKARDSSDGDQHDSHAAIFVEFSSQATAQQAYSQLQYHVPLRLTPRYIGVQPKEVIWKNLTLPQSARISRHYLATAFIIATIILWSIPIGFVGAISNVNYLADKVHFLGFIKKLPAPILGLITGLLPPYLISTLVSYVPKIFRYIAKLSGEPSNSQAELKTQNWYLIFQVIQVFLVTTFSSGAAAVATKIANQPTLVPTLLAKNLPKASNFYLTYFILQGTASAAKNVLNYSDLLLYLGYDKFMDKTPRAKYARYTQMKGISWGSVYPKFTNMAIIAIAYSCIAPLVLGFAAIGLYLYYLSYRYNLLFVVQSKIDTRGECYTHALQHLLVGVYLSELCLIGLFGAREATGPSILMAILFILTIVYHHIMNKYLGPLESSLPSSLSTEDDETPLLAAAEEGTTGNDDSNQPVSHIHFLVQQHNVPIPPKVLNPIAKFFEPHVFDSPAALKSWLRDDSSSFDDDDAVPNYTDNDLDNAYINPALTSKTPKLWLVRDELGVSKREIEADEAAGISATDEGAVLDAKNHIRWNSEGDLTDVPIFKKPVKY